jgi:hypothetical protein
MDSVKEKKLQIGLAAKIIAIFCATVTFVALIALVVSGFSSDFANFWWQHVTKPVDNAMYLFFQHIPVKDYVLLVELAVIAGLCVLIPKVGRGFAVSMASIVLMAGVLPLLGYCQQASIDKIDTMYFSGNEQKSYTADDLYDLAIYFREKMKELAPKAIKAEQQYGTEMLVDKAVANLVWQRREFGFLDGAIVSDIELGSYEYTGMTFPYRVTVDENYPAGELLNTITHELCHSKGILRENEATFCAIATEINSQDDFSKYVGYAEALRMSAIALTLEKYDTTKIKKLYGANQGKCGIRSAECAQIFLNVDDLGDYAAMSSDEYVDQLAPFSEGSDIGMMLFDRAGFDMEYDYSRSARLLLEYFDGKIEQ